MSTENLSEIVGEDVNLASEAPETPEAPQETQAATPEAPATPEEGKEPDSRVVPLAALHEERQRRKELAANIENMRAEQARRDAILEQRLSQLTQAREAANVPSFEENPAAHLMHGQQQTQQSVEQMRQAITQWQTQQHQAQVFNALTNHIQQQEAAFVQQAPDYQEAVAHLRNQMAAEIAADGADPETAAEEATKRIKLFAYQKAQQGMNPAQAAYAIAKARGYAPKAAQPAQPTGEQVIKSQQKISTASKTLGGGGAPAGKLTLEALATMSDEEFAEATKGNKWAQLVG